MIISLMLSFPLECFNGLSTTCLFLYILITANIFISVFSQVRLSAFLLEDEIPHNV